VSKAKLDFYTKKALAASNEFKTIVTEHRRVENRLDDLIDGNIPYLEIYSSVKEIGDQEAK